MIEEKSRQDWREEAAAEIEKALPHLRRARLILEDDPNFASWCNQYTWSFVDMRNQLKDRG